MEGLSGGYVGIGLDEFGNFSDPGEGRNGGPGRDRDSVTVRGPGDGDEGYEFVASSGTIQEGLDEPNVPERPDQTGDLFRSVSLWFRPVESQFSLSLNLQTGADSEPQEIFQDLLLPGTGSGIGALWLHSYQRRLTELPRGQEPGGGPGAD